jgi:hypothetical protein
MIMISLPSQLLCICTLLMTTAFCLLVTSLYHLASNCGCTPSSLCLAQFIYRENSLNHRYPRIIQSVPRLVIKKVCTTSLFPCAMHSLQKCVRVSAWFIGPSALVTLCGHFRGYFATCRASTVLRSMRFSMAPLSKRVFTSAICYIN